MKEDEKDLCQIPVVMHCIYGLMKWIMQTYVGTGFLFSLYETVTGSNNYEFIIYTTVGDNSANMPFCGSCRNFVI